MPRYTLLELLRGPAVTPKVGRSAAKSHAHSIAEIGSNEAPFKTPAGYHRQRPPPALQDLRRGGSDAFLALTVHIERLGAALDHFTVDHHFVDPVERRQVIHGVEQNCLHDRPKATGAGLAQDRFLRDGLERVVGELELHVLHVEQTL